MSALEIAKQMSREELWDKIAALDLKEYETCRDTLIRRLELAKEESAEEDRPLGVAAALNNADVDGVLLNILKTEPEKVMEGIGAAAYALGTDKKLLYIPEYAPELAEDEAVRSAAEKCGVEIRSEFVNVRANKGNALIHIVTALSLAEALEGTYTPGVYVSVNGGDLKKAASDTKIADLVDLEGVKALRAGYDYITLEDAQMTVAEAGIDNGVLKTVTEKQCIVAQTEEVLTGYRKQSCGKCVFCREGLLQLQFMQKEITEGRGKAEFIDLTKEIGEAMIYSTPCSVGQVSSKIALDAVNLFGSEYRAHIKKKKCPAGVCFSTETIYIDPKLCSGCGECMDVCPKDCIEGKSKYIHMIDDMECDKCGKCMEVCGEEAIIKTDGKLPKLPNRLTKVGRFKKR